MVGAYKEVVSVERLALEQYSPKMGRWVQTDTRFNTDVFPQVGKVSNIDSSIGKKDAGYDRTGLYRFHENTCARAGCGFKKKQISTRKCPACEGDKWVAEPGPTFTFTPNINYIVNQEKALQKDLGEGFLPLFLPDLMCGWIIDERAWIAAGEKPFPKCQKKRRRLEELPSCPDRLLR